MPHGPMTREQVEDVMGRLDDLKLAEILEVGASVPELLEAKRWMLGYKRTIADDLPMRPNVVGMLCDIMRTDEPEWYDSGG